MDRFEPFRVIVCGGRDFIDWEEGFAALDEVNALRGPIAMVVHGNASGADSLGKAWAHERHIPDWPFPAEWSKYGKSAGPRRNKQMLGSGARLVIAFPGGKGTRNMVNQALNAGIDVIHVCSPTPTEI